MYLFFDNVPFNPMAEILKLKLQSPPYLGAARTEIGLKKGGQLCSLMTCPVHYVRTLPTYIIYHNMRDFMIVYSNIL